MKPSAEDRFWGKVKKSDGCWEWQGATHRGYGTFHVLDGVRKTVKAHRFSYELACEPIPAGLEILHACDNRRCVNPKHLSVGTRADNMRDAANKGRICTIGKSKITHCPAGHEYSDGNVYFTKAGHRRCKTCTNEQQRVKYLQKNPGITVRGPRATAIRRGN